MSEVQDGEIGPTSPEAGPPPTPGSTPVPGTPRAEFPPAPSASAPWSAPGNAFSAGTPATVAGLPLAGIGRRFLGYLIDGVVLSLAYLVLSSIFTSTTTVLTTTGSVTVRTGSPLADALLLIIEAAYFTLLWSRQGASLGQMAMGVKVVDASTGGPVGQTQALVRFVGYIVSGIVIFIGFIWAFFDARKQGWMDKMANTLVVRVSRP